MKFKVGDYVKIQFPEDYESGDQGIVDTYNGKIGFIKLIGIGKHCYVVLFPNILEKELSFAEEELVFIERKNIINNAEVKEI